MPKASNKNKLDESQDVVFEDPPETMIDSESPPEYGDSNWESYVMSNFLEDELYDGSYPTLNGMRRVALDLIGVPSFSGPVQVISNLPESSYCIYKLAFMDMHIEIRAAADAHEENIFGNYKIYPTAIAESRAEARAYRKALLISTVSAEEIRGDENVINLFANKNSNINVNDRESGRISDQQKKIIESKCKQLKIDLNKFLEKEGVNLSKATKQDGINLAKSITKLSQQDSIPQELRSS